jgi:putative transposase
MGKTPEQVFFAVPQEPDLFDERCLRDALTIRARRRVRRDNTLAMDGENWETSLHFLAGRLVTVARSLAEPESAPWIEHEGRNYALSLVDPVRNGRRTRSTMNLDAAHSSRVPFDPPRALLERALGRTHVEIDEEAGGS